MPEVILDPNKPTAVTTPPVVAPAPVVEPVVAPVVSTETPPAIAAPVVEPPKPTDTSAVNVEDFERAMEGLGKSTEVKPVDKPAVPAVAVVAPVVPTTTITTTAAPVKPVVPLPNERDYSDLDEVEAPLFRAMGNDSYAKLKPAYLEWKKQKEVLAAKDTEIATLKQGKTQLPESYYQHQDAYVLTPEFRENAEVVQKAMDYQAHWEKQLIAIKKGEDWTPVVQNQQGAWVLGATKPATPEAEVEVMNNYQAMARTVNDYNGRNAALAQTHTARHQQGIGLIQEGTKKFYGFLDTAEQAAAYKPQLESVRNMFPKEFHGHPLMDLAVRATVTSMMFQKALQAAESKNTQVATIQATTAEQAKLAGPNNSTITAPGGGVAKPAVSMADFEALGL